jgi:hypothetical protein
MSVCPVELGICAARLTRLDSLGNVAAGPNNSWVTDKIQSIQITPEVLTGADRDMVNGCGCVVATFKDKDRLKRFTFQFVDGAFEAGMHEMLLGATLVTDGGQTVGVDVAGQLFCDDPQAPGVALEFWSKAITADHQNPTYPWVHYVFPWTEWQYAQNQAQNDFNPNALTGFSRRNPLWSHGPYSDQPAPITGIFGKFLTGSAIPTAACGYATVAPAS